MSCHVMSCHVMLCYVILCYVMLCYVIVSKTFESCSYIETVLLDKSLEVRRQMADLF